MRATLKTDQEQPFPTPLQAEVPGGFATVEISQAAADFPNPRLANRQNRVLMLRILVLLIR